MDITKQVHAMDALIEKGAIVDAAKSFFAECAITSDYENTTTSSRNEMVNKMEQFANSIAKVNGITRHHTVVNANISASEFTFDFDMKDGSKIFWHEIIRRVWNDDGKVIHEEYFKS